MKPYHFVLMFILTSTWLMGEHSSVFAQACSVGPIANKVGDEITFTARMKTTDPDDSTIEEAEPASISTSGGEISGQLVVDYNTSFPFSYRATQINETITGNFFSGDGDEECFIADVMVNGASALNLEDKKAGHTIGVDATGLSIGLGTAVGIATIFGACEIATVGACTVAIAAGGSLGISGLMMTETYPADPSDQNFMVIATPTITTVPPFVPSPGFTQSEADAFNALIINQQTIVATAQAAVTSANRAQGAKEVGNAVWQLRQTQAAQLYTVEIGGLVSKEVSLLTKLRDALMAAGVSGNITVNDVFNFQQQIASSGLPPQMVQALTRLGADQATIDKIKILLIGVNGRNVAGKFPDILVSPQIISSLQAAAAVLTGVTIDIKSNKIEPKDDEAIKVAIITTKNFDAATVDTSSVRFGLNGAAAFENHFQDVNHDGKPDLVMHFANRQTGVQCGDTMVVLTGKTKVNQSFSGAGSIQTVDCHKRGHERN